MSTVRMSGYLGIHDGMVSDQIMCYAVCDMHILLGGKINQIIPPQMRAFKCDDKVQSQICIKELSENNKTIQLLRG